MDSMTKRLTYLEFVHRENNFHHHTHRDELLQFQYIKDGDMRSVEESHRLFTSTGVGLLSDDPVKNCRYHFICSVTLATRAAIEGGMNENAAFNTSDLYIQTVDGISDVNKIVELHDEMIAFFTKQLAIIKKKKMSKPIEEVFDYVYNHLHCNFGGRELSAATNLNYSYLSTLFKKETGISISEYVMQKRMEAAENMLLYSDYQLSEIGEILAFSSYSHFAKAFRKYHSMSPKQFRNKPV